MKIALCQLNPTVADLAGNSRRVLEAYEQAASDGADLVVFPELALAGYPPLDLLERASFIEGCEQALAALAPRLGGPAAVVGTVRRHPLPRGRSVCNSAALIVSGQVVGFHDKMLLPSYDVFDEDRYFEPGVAAQVFEVAGVRLGIAICEDLWTLAPADFRARYGVDPGLELARAGARLIVSPSASPYHRGKGRMRDRLFAAQAARLGIPVAFCNQVGGNTDLIFDGNSLVATPTGGVVRRAASFREDRLVFDLDAVDDGARAASAPAPWPDEAEEVAQALVLGLRDYFRKCGFRRAVVGLSGGIDSAVTAALAVDALGAEAVSGVALPSRYSSPGSLRDARELSARLGTRLSEISIEPLFEAALRALAPIFQDRPSDVTEENLQARLRMALLMAHSNKFGEVLLTTGNKSELAVGYCTIYGDMAGGLAVLGDVPKTLVYAMARLPAYRARIPTETLTKPPSAELRPDQTDQDSLPPYEVLDAILEAYVERGEDVAHISAAGHDPFVVAEVVRLVEHNEYKRRQAAPTLRVSPKAFGMGRRLPIARRFQEPRPQAEILPGP